MSIGNRKARTHPTESHAIRLVPQARYGEARQAIRSFSRRTNVIAAIQKLSAKTRGISSGVYSATEAANVAATG